jgi:hypothetical protein
MTFTALLTATFASAALGAGVLLAMIGAVVFVTAGEPGFGAGRRRYRCIAALAAVAGVVIFASGTIVGLDTLA